MVADADALPHGGGFSLAPAFRVILYLLMKKMLMSTSPAKVDVRYIWISLIGALFQTLGFLSMIKSTRRYQERR